MNKIFLTGTLNKMIEQGVLNQEQIDSVGACILHYSNQIKKFDAHSIEGLKGVYELIDTLIESTNKISKKASCLKGCSHCCHVTVDATPLEVEYVLQYASENGIEIDMDALAQQSKSSYLERPGLEKSACVFLKDGTCSVYNARPTACRKYFVINKPCFCDAKTYPSSKTDVLADFHVECLVSGLYTAFNGVSDFSKEMLKQINNNGQSKSSGLPASEPTGIN